MRTILPLLAILFLSACGGGGGSSTSQNRASNPGFEADGAWTYERAARRTDGGHTGEGYASLVPRRGSSSQFYPARLAQKLKGLVAGRTYRVAFWAKGAASEGSPTFTAALGDSSSSVPVPTSDQGWVQHTVVLVAPRPGDGLTFAASLASVSIDDVEVRPLP